MSSGVKSHYLANYETIAPDLPGQNLPWLQQLRREGLKNFSEHGFPSPREEEWRYTNVSAIEKKQFTPLLGCSPSQLSSESIDANWLKSKQLEDAWVVVMIDGHFSPEVSELSGLPETLVVMGMVLALAQSSDSLKSYLGQAVSSDEHNFIAFNNAWFADGLYIHIPTQQKLSKPIQILHVVTQANVLATTRNVIVLDDFSGAVLVETFVSTTQDAYLSTAVTEVFVGENAELTSYKFQAESENAYHFGGSYVHQASYARFIHHNFAFGGLLSRSDIHTELNKAAECELNGLYLGVNRQHLDNHTRIIHSKPHTISREMYKGVLDNRARGIFQGRVIVAEDAQKTDSQMNNRTLLLSAEAEANTKPQLEIYADDVKCSHGVTVGQLDEKSIFYLQSRCVDEETARNMLTFAFANEMVDKIKIKSLHDQVLEHVLARFPQEGIQKEWL